MGQPFDASSKWLIQNYADSILKLAGITGVESWTALPGELVQSRQLPDGLLEARMTGQPEPVLFLIEINTYPEKRVASELLDDILLTYLNRRRVPELITLLLHPKGNARVPDHWSVASRLNGSELSVRWRVVELWTLDFESFLPNPEPGLAPWLTLARMPTTPEAGLQLLRTAIDRVADDGIRANLLAVSQILGGLQYDYDMLKALFGQEGAMIESPFLIERDRRNQTKLICRQLEAKFGKIPNDLINAVNRIPDEESIARVAERLVLVNTLDEFREALPK